MSKSIILAAAAAAALSPISAAVAATPQVPDDGGIAHYAVNSEELDAWHGAVQGFSASRRVRNKNTGVVSDMDAKRINACLGYDVTPWMTVYALAGVLNTKDTRDWLESDTAVAYGAGAWFQLLDDDQLDFLDTISRWRVTAGLEFAYGDPDDLAWKQFDGFLAFEILNDMYLHDAMFPAQVGVFAGPVFSKIDLDGYESEGNNDWGFSAGGVLRFADGVYAQGAYSWFGDDSVASFSAGFRF